MDGMGRGSSKKKHRCQAVKLSVPVRGQDVGDGGLINKGCGLVLGIFFFFWGAFFFFGSVGFVPAFFPAHVVWLGGVFVVLWWCFCGGVLVVVFVW